MINLRTLLPKIRPGEKNSTRDDLLKNERLLQFVETFLSKHGFTNLDFYGAGNSAIVFQDLDNPALVLRIAQPSDVRPVVPQMLQPIHVVPISSQENGSLPRLKLEFMKNISAFMHDSTAVGMIHDFEREVKASGYEVDSYHLDEDCGIFTYDDLKKPNTKKSVVMGADASTLERGKLDFTNFPSITCLTHQPPTCTANYPTLKDQWDEQCKMVEADPRLKAMIGGLPAKLPTTRVIPSISGERGP